MTTTRQLLSLQKLDLVLDKLQDEKTKAEEELSSSLAVEHLETAFQEENERLVEAQGQHTAQQLETETLRERSVRLDAQLYDGTITNPRDLEALELEATNARELLEQQDTGLLELSAQAEEYQTRRDQLDSELSDAKTAWKIRRAELKVQLKRCTTEVKTMSTQRKDLVASLDPSAVQRYEGLRRAKGGVAVAKVERGLCQACRMALPTQQQQRVRIGRQTVLCSSCGRILILG